MADYTVKRIGAMEATFGGGFRLARAELGVESFGMQVIDLPANFDDYPEHDESESGQEEVYVLLSGTATVEVDGEIVELVPGQNMIRVGPSAMRKLRSGEERARILALGGVPGKVYEAPDTTKLSGT